MSNTKKPNAVEILLIDARGVDIPRDFCDFALSLWSGIDNIKLSDLENPENEFYWDTWQIILDNAEFHHSGNVWRLHQDGDLFAYCFELMTREEKENFGFDIDDDEEENDELE